LPPPSTSRWRPPRRWSRSPSACAPPIAASCRRSGRADHRGRARRAGAGPFLPRRCRLPARRHPPDLRRGDAAQIEAAARLGAHAIELHTGTYADAAPEDRAPHLARLRAGAEAAAALGLAVHAGHGLSYETIGDIARIPQVCEVSIGHFLVGQAVFEGLPNAVRRMKALIAEARRGAVSTG
jgi:pyridoxine 5-phosphate synthase